MQTKEIKNKLKAVGNIKKITRTMEMVSVAKMKKTVAKAQSSKPYTKKALELLVNIAKEKAITHPFLEKRDSDKALLVIIGSNKGLCGGYNTNINKAVKNFINLRPEGKTNLTSIAIGKQAEKIAKRNNLPLIASFTEFSDYVSVEEVAVLANIAKKDFLDRKYDYVYIVFTEFIKPLTYEVSAKQVLPIIPQIIKNIIKPDEDTRSEEEKSLAQYQLEPNEHEIVDSIVPSLITTAIYQAILESYASEHSSRMVAMKGATDNATNLLADLKLSYNKARQEAITREIAEISAGANAV